MGVLKAISVAALTLALLGISLPVTAQENSSAAQNSGNQLARQISYDAKITSTYQGACPSDPNTQCLLGKALIYKTDGSAEEKEVQLDSLDPRESGNYNFQEGDKIWISEIRKADSSTIYVVQNPNRQTGFWIIGIILIIAAIAVARLKGLGAVLALFITTGIVFGLLLPQLLQNPDKILLIGLPIALLILIINQLIGHGLNKNSLLGLAGGVVSFGVVVGISLLLKYFFKINGLGTDGATFLRSSLPANFNFADLFLVGSLLGVCGALDDVTSAQATTVDELHKAQPDNNFIQLYRQGVRIGTEHLVSMINTLVLAYIGAALPTLLVFQVLTGQDLFVILSRADFTEEILRSFLASLALILAIPLTNVLASWWATRKSKAKPSKSRVKV
jgi:uncharacterized membrane protein